ncbi:unnamed protein product [Caenorhabditis angaria]|uniref:EGF-like domain-containing protein n=1 Tax=Caenorhabditis angaria TaxID=860376 RepID=A0A9P1I5D1_9PELO|nr:unnamed protein product [Caenorhabditis angaria]
MRLLILALFAFSTVNGLIINNTNKTCDAHSEFDCNGDGKKCVPLDWKCDHVEDCENGRDERNCNYIHECPPGLMACGSGECVAHEFKCDGDQDCSDGADERHCQESESHFINMLQVRHHAMIEHFRRFEDRCDSPRFKCKSGQCISRDLVCDDSEDCLDGDDEAGCFIPHHQMFFSLSNASKPEEDKKEKEPHCQSGYIACPDSSICLPTIFMCDGEEDCEDGSDEKNCNIDDHLDEEDFMTGNIEIIQNCTAQGKFHCQAVDGQLPTCIPMNATCNGIRECPNGDDESMKCSECSTKHCDHSCLNSPHGARCVCQEGYKLDSDGLTCVDEDECAISGHNLCAHFCEDRIGKYVCRCDSGYTLDAEDGHTCRLTRGSHDGRLLVSIGSEIRQMALQDAQGTYTTVQRVSGHGASKSIDYLQKIDKIFMAIAHQNEPQDGELAVADKGVLRVLREKVAGIGHIAVDWIGNNVFFTQKAPAKHIGITVCRIDGLFCRWILQGREAPQTSSTLFGVSTAQQNYRGLAVHPLRGLLVWIDSFMGHNKIMAANMDGTDVRVIVENKLEYPSGLAIDYIRHDVYFGDVEMKIIERVNLDSKHRSVVVSQGVHHPFDLAVFNGFVYWSDWGSESLKAHQIAHHHDHSTTQTLHSYNRFPYGLAVNHSMYQPQSTSNPCQFLNCPWICVIVESQPNIASAKCICPDAYKHSILDNTCVPPNEQERMEIAGNLSHVSAALMAEYCDAGVACKNGGKCEHLKNEHGRVHQIQCQCPEPFDGEFCERFNPELDKLLREREATGALWALVLIALLIVAFVAIVLYLVCVQREATLDAITCARIRVDNMARSAESAAGPIVNKVKNIAGIGGGAEKSPRAGIYQTNVNFVDETHQDQQLPRGDQQRQLFMDSPSSFRNPIYDEVPATATYTQIGTESSGASPISGSGVIRFNSDGLF